MQKKDAGVPDAARSHAAQSSMRASAPNLKGGAGTSVALISLVRESALQASSHPMSLRADMYRRNAAAARQRAKQQVTCRLREHSKTWRAAGY